MKFAGLGLASFLLMLLAYAPRSSAIIEPCSITGYASFSPVHPESADVISYAVGMYVYRDSLGPASATVSRSVATGSVISIDMIITSNPARFPGYQLDSALGHGSLGQLAPGQYLVTTSLRFDDPQTGNLSGACGSKDSRLIVYASSGLASVVEYYNAKLDHYFMTQDAVEIADLDSGVHPGWVRTGQSFSAFRPGETAGQVPAVWRFYGLPSVGIDSHFYSADVADHFHLLVGPLAADWILETNDAFELALPDTSTGACARETIPVYRLWNQRVDSNHRYTTDLLIRAQMIARGYAPEGYGADGVAMCAPN